MRVGAACVGPKIGAGGSDANKLLEESKQLKQEAASRQSAEVRALVTAGREQM